MGSIGTDPFPVKGAMGVIINEEGVKASYTY